MDSIGTPARYTRAITGNSGWAAVSRGITPSVDAGVSGAEWSEGELRRLRLHIAGKFGSNFKYKIELNTNSSGDVDVEDAYGQWAPTGGDWNIKAGQFKTPNSLDEQTSSRFISVLEARSVSLMLFNSNANWASA